MESATTLVRQDDDLILAVARGRDKDAFFELYRRYEHEAFNVAMHVTGRRHLAEEAVQQAMLEVWRSAERYKPECFRNWLLRIVANASLKVLRGIRTRREKTMEHLPEPSFEDQSPERGLERAELVHALRGFMAQLPQADRRLLSLYFVAGMTQKEIGKALAMPTRTVSFKIDESVRQLRAMLERAGFASAIPLLTVDTYSETLCSFLRAPASLGERVRRHIQSPAPNVKRHVRQRGPALYVAATMLCSGVVVMAVGWHGIQGSKAPPLAPPQAAMSPVETWLPLPARWNFADGPAANLEVFQQHWAWRRQDNLGVMDPNIPAPGAPLGVILPRFQCDRPVTITVEVEQPKGVMRGLGLDVIWIDQHRLVENVCRGVGAPFEKALNTYQFYLFDKYIVMHLNGKAVTLYEYDSSYPGNRIGMIARSWLVRSIEVREMTQAELNVIKLPDIVRQMTRDDSRYSTTMKAQSLHYRD